MRSLFNVLTSLYAAILMFPDRFLNRHFPSCVQFLSISRQMTKKFLKKRADFYVCPFSNNYFSSSFFRRMLSTSIRFSSGGVFAFG